MATTDIIHLDEGESIVREVRKHPIVLYGRLALLVIFFFAPLFASPLLVRGIDYISGTARGALIFGLLLNMWALVLWIAFFFEWTQYHLDVWVISNRHIFDIDQKTPFHQEVSTFRIDHIQDVSVETKGLMGSLCKFGDIHVYTAGENQNLVITQARRPLEVKNVIMEMQNKLAPHLATATASVSETESN